MFSHKEDESYSQMKNNTISQLTRMSEIINHAGKFKKFFNELNNITDSLNTSLESYVINAKKAILFDIYDGIIESINFEKYKQKFVNDIKKHEKIIIPKYKHVDFNLDEYLIDLYDTDIYNSMLDVLDESTIKKFAKLQHEANHSINDLFDSLNNFEENLCSFRTQKIEEMLNNIETLYLIHLNYAKHSIKNKSKQINLPQEITIDNILIPISNSQKQFITTALKKIICNE